MPDRPLPSEPADARRRELLCHAVRYAAACATVSACGGGHGDPGSPWPAPAPSPPAGPPARLTRWVTGLQQPWGLAFLPDGSALVTEKPGRLRHVDTEGTLSAPLSGVPGVYSGADTQGGLLDVVIDPNFTANRRIYLSYAEPDQGGAYTGIGTAVARAVLSADLRNLEAVTVIYRQTPRFNGDGHFGSRLVFGRDGHLFITLGDRQVQTEAPQTTDNHLGKVVRITTDGGNPGNNFSGLIWSVGHRNPQGAAIHPDTGELWISEHGPQGGDEINRVLRGGNYGWPRVSYGCPYGQTPGEACRIGGGTHAPSFVEPAWYWVPISCAPSGMCFYTGDRFPEWRGNLFVGTMADQRCLRRLTLNGPTVTSEERLFRSLDVRMRDVKQGPDGWLYVLDETNGHILRIDR
ncbi:MULTISPECIES: PQQ-dependent sugar dehydrogenase [Caldimonas]|uniref:PQQ-dependent sugar dehydrogenase n=1 Tax=Caldimonas TaxID=196013 RepID=UPI000369EA22|nr:MULTISPECIES: PQQ-dependent sugar dehydrogenase [Caldimonas]